MLSMTRRILVTTGLVLVATLAMPVARAQNAAPAPTGFSKASADANAKFERRFASIEKALAARGKTPSEASLAEMDALWNDAKAAER